MITGQQTESFVLLDDYRTGGNGPGDGKGEGKGKGGDTGGVRGQKAGTLRGLAKGERLSRRWSTIKGIPYKVKRIYARNKAKEKGLKKGEQYWEVTGHWWPDAGAPKGFRRQKIAAKNRKRTKSPR